MPGKVLISRVPKQLIKTITFTGASGLGLVNVAVPVATVTGRILIVRMAIHCLTSLTGGGATLTLGTTSNVAAMIGLTTATTLDANEFWDDSTPEAGVAQITSLVDTALSESLQIDPLTATIATGALEFSIFWLPLSVNGNLA